MYTKQAATDLTTRHFQGPFWRLAALLCQHSLQGCEGAYWGITGAALGPDPHSCFTGDWRKGTQVLQRHSRAARRAQVFLLLFVFVSCNRTEKLDRRQELNTGHPNFIQNKIRPLTSFVCWHISNSCSTRHVGYPTSFIPYSTDSLACKGTHFSQAFLHNTSVRVASHLFKENKKGKKVYHIKYIYFQSYAG